VALSDLPLAPRNPLPYRQQMKAIRMFHTGLETLRDAGGPATRPKLAPKWLMPQVVVATSPQGAHDILGRGGGHIEKTRVHHEMRQ
ncbi:cytochrome P450, partial [Mycobacterium sp. ITM-2017-0098]